jgi:hypothetical protein
MKTTKEKAEKIAQVVKDSVSYRDAARKLNMSGPTISLYCKKYNINTNHFTYNKNYKGFKNGRLTVLSVERDKDSRGTARKIATCICDCGGTKKCRIDYIICGKVIACSPKCSREHNNTILLGMNNPAFTGYGQVTGRYFGGVKSGAKRRNLEFNVTIEYLSELFEKQNGKCALTGLDLHFGYSRYLNATASLDRIDNTKGYEEGNVHWVHREINLMKLDHSLEHFIELCRLVTENNSNVRKRKLRAT